MSPALPIDAVLADLRAALAAHSSVVLVAPPGAGKTTRVPLVLMDEPWLAGRKILVLEPRRIAARAAAARMAFTLGEPLGRRVGLKARLASFGSAATRIEVVTEGVFTRMIIDDPELSGIGAVLFDEFHERSLDADLGLALARDAQQGLRPDLRIVPMSATLDGARIAGHLGPDTPVIQSEGRSFPVETRYVSRDVQARLEDEVARVVGRALAEERGSLLVFLPGQAEIRRVAERLGERLPADVDLAPLHGGLEAGEQDSAIRPAPAGRRKVVLATSIAETSITIEDVRVVIDSGLARVPRFDPDAGVTRLATVRVSLSAADQRRGRAGRTAPGVCYRLWDEPQTKALLPFAEPEIRNADLSGLLLDCACWGVNDPAALTWLDPPPSGAVAAARADLEAVGALDRSGALTDLGRQLVALPLPPRLAAMLVRAAQHGDERLAAELAAVLVERGLGGNDAEIMVRLARFRTDRSRRAQSMRALAGNWARQARAQPNVKPRDVGAAMILAEAFPDRIAKARGGDGQFLLANGRGARLDPHEALSRAPWIVAVELTGSAAASRIMLATAITEDDVLVAAGGQIAETIEADFDRQSRSVRVRRVRRLGAITIASEPRPAGEATDASEILAKGLVEIGVDQLPWSKAQQQLRARVAFIRHADPQWPDLGDAALSQSWRDWLAPVLAGKTSASEIGAEDLDAALSILLPWALRQKLDALMPTHFTAPTGMQHRIDYGAEGGPTVEVRVQELFGIRTHPTVAGGIALVFKLLSPAHRPIQITRDLPGFWRGSWLAVRADMRGQYPKHFWPENPGEATPTTRAKPRDQG